MRSSRPPRRRSSPCVLGTVYGTIQTGIVAAGGDFYAAECYHQQYLSGSKNPDGYCGLDGTGVKLGDPFETNWGTSCPTGIAPAPEASEK